MYFLLMSGLVILSLLLILTLLLKLFLYKVLCYKFPLIEILISVGNVTLSSNLYIGTQHNPLPWQPEINIYKNMKIFYIICMKIFDLEQIFQASHVC